MAHIDYSFIDAQGQVHRATTQADSVSGLTENLSRQGVSLLHARRRLLHRPARQLSLRERIQFCAQLEQYLNAGIPLLDALQELATHGPYARSRTLISQLLTHIASGASLSQALDSEGRVFDTASRALVAAGEASGQLPQILARHADTLRREEALRASLARLSIYPAFVLIATLVAALVALLVVVPQLEKLFRSSGLALPFQTRLLIDSAGFLSAQWAPLLIGTVLLLAAIAILPQHLPRLALWRDRALLRIPLLGRIHSQGHLARLAALLAQIHCAGIPITENLGLSRDATCNRHYQDALEKVSRGLAVGLPLAVAFEASGAFPPLFLRMLRVGEQTGELDASLLRLSQLYERDTDEASKRLQSCMEPLLIALLGGLMGWIALAVLGPVHDIVTRLPL